MVGNFVIEVGLGVFVKLWNYLGISLSKLGIKEIVGFMKHQTVKIKHSILGVAY